MAQRILMAVGGTGGHLFPAIALAEELKDKYGIEVSFAGGKLKENSLITNQKGVFHEVPCGKLSKNPLQFCQESFCLLKGVKESISLIRAFSPDAVVGFGSYHSLPVLIAAKILGKRIFLHEGNSVPGKVNRFFSPFAEKTWVQFPIALKSLPKGTELGGLPLRKEYKKGAFLPQDARKAFQLYPDMLTFLVVGGSQGAKKLNSLFSSAVLFHLKELLPPFQVIHAAGSHEESEQLMGRYVTASIPAYVRPFITKMECAWSAANLSITRAGAASLTEQYEFEVPGIVIPYPFAADNHQEKNADFLAPTGLVMKLSEQELTPQELAMKIQELHLAANAIQERLKRYKRENPVPLLSDLLIEELKKR